MDWPTASVLGVLALGTIEVFEQLLAALSPNR